MNEKVRIKCNKMDRSEEGYTNEKKSWGEMNETKNEKEWTNEEE